MSLSPLPSKLPTDFPSTKGDLNFCGEDLSSILLGLGEDNSSKSVNLQPSPLSVPNPPIPSVSTSRIDREGSEAPAIQAVHLVQPPSPPSLSVPTVISLPSDEKVIDWCRSRRRSLGLSTAAVRHADIPKDSLGRPMLNDLGMLCCCYCFSVARPMRCACACHTWGVASVVPSVPKKRAKAIVQKECKSKRQKGTSVRCSYCGENGHNKVSCEARKLDPRYRPPEKQKYSCTRCGKSGHSKKKCPNDPLPEATPSKPNNYKCSVCGELGHNARRHATEE